MHTRDMELLSRNLKKAVNILTKIETRVKTKQDAEVKNKARIVLNKAIAEGIVSPATVKAHVESFHTQSSESYPRTENSVSIEEFSGFTDDDHNQFRVDSGLFYDKCDVDVQDGAPVGDPIETQFKTETLSPKALNDNTVKTITSRGHEAKPDTNSWQTLIHNFWKELASVKRNFYWQGVNGHHRLVCA